MIKDRITADQLKECLRQHPTEFDMDSYVEYTTCGTSFCIAGWAMALAGYEVVKNEDGDAVFDIPKSKYECGIAGQLLDVGSTLFYESLWPTHLLCKGPETPEEKIERACKAIDYFMGPQQPA